MLGFYQAVFRGFYWHRCKYLTSGLPFYKDRGVLRTVSNAFDGGFWRKAKKFHITLEKSSILKISVKKTNLFIIEGKKFCMTLFQNKTEDWNYKNFYISCNLKK